MRYRLIALFSAVFSILAAFCVAAMAEEAKNDVKGLFLLTDYPAVTLRPGTTSTINLKLQNYGLPPERLALSVGGVSCGGPGVLGGGRPAGGGGAGPKKSKGGARAAPPPPKAPSKPPHHLH